MIELNEIKRFKEALKGIVDGISAMAHYPSEKRIEYLNIIKGTMLLLNEVFNMLILHLGDLLVIAENARLCTTKEGRKDWWSTFKLELCKIDFRDDWANKEREVRLCPNLRESLCKTQGMLGELKGKIALGSNLDAVNDFMDKTLEKEDRVADYISQKLKALGKAARKAGSTQRELKDLVKLVEDTAESFKNERTELMRFEIEISNRINMISTEK